MYPPRRSSVRKFVQSKRYSPTTSSTSPFDVGGCTCNRLSVEGVRKQLTMPSSGRVTIEGRAADERRDLCGRR